jgi:hypothetical protein
VFPGRERKKSEPLHGNAPKKESLSAQITAMDKFIIRKIRDCSGPTENGAINLPAAAAARAAADARRCAAKPALEAAVPANLRAADGSWFTLATRARVVYAAKNLPVDALNYENLADPKWKGKICIR